MMILKKTIIIVSLWCQPLPLMGVNEYGAIHLSCLQENQVFDLPSSLCPHEADPSFLCGHPHAVDVKYTSLSWNC